VKEREKNGCHLVDLILFHCVLFPVFTLVLRKKDFHVAVKGVKEYRKGQTEKGLVKGVHRDESVRLLLEGDVTTEKDRQKIGGKLMS